MPEEPEEAQGPAGVRRTPRVLDLRSIIAALFTVFGVLVLIAGLTASPEEVERAGGINISVWTGVALLALAAGFGLWVRLAPPDIAHSSTEEHPADPPS